MNIKCLYLARSRKEFYGKFDSLNLKSWNIENQLFKDRAKYYEKHKFFIDLKDEFMDKSLTIWDLKSEEVVSWIDTFLILKRILEDSVFNDEVINLTIIKEYPIVFGNHMRVDYLLVFERAIIVLEMGMFNQDERRGEERYTKKLLESIAYRQIIENIVKGSVDVFNYTLIYRPEYDRIKNTWLRNNINYNNDEIGKIIKFISKIVTEQVNKKAINQLLQLEKLR